MSSASPSARPFISVIVPTFDRPQRLLRCHRALLQQTYPDTHFEILVVDDGGTHSLRDLQPDDRTRWINAEHGGPGAARNVGVISSRGSLLAFTDDDCVPEPGWLEQLAAQAADRSNTVLGGRTVNYLPDNPFDSTSQVILETAYRHQANHPRFFASNNLAMSRKSFDQIGGFDESFRIASEDRDFCDRARQAGLLLEFAPDAVVQHAHDLDFSKFFSQHFRYGRGARRFHLKRSKRGAGGLARELPFHASFLRHATAPLRSLRPMRRIQAIPLLAVWQLANAIGFGYECVRPDLPLSTGQTNDRPVRRQT